MAAFTPVPATDPIYPQSDIIDELVINVIDRAEALREEWLELQKSGIATPYQSYDWVQTWQTAVSDQTGEQIRIVSIRDGSGTLLAILPLAIERAWGATIAKWASSSLINYGMPVMSAEFAKIARENPFQLMRLVGEALPGVDALHLGFQPGAWDGLENPFAATFTDVGANRTYLTNLPADYESLYTNKRSKQTRRNNRRRDAKLGRFGEVNFGLPKDSEETTHVLSTLFSFVRDRLGKQGISDPYGDEGVKFYSALAKLPESAPLQLKPYVLKTDEEIVAVNMGAEYKGRFCGLVCSIIDGPQTTHSPGDLALRKTIETCCTDGVEIFDFSAGDSPYKFHWADQTVPLAETVFPVTGAGYGYAALVLPQLSTKRIIKNSTWLWSMAQRARKMAAPIITRKSA